jgi:hypothetical protein
MWHDKIVWQEVVITFTGQEVLVMVANQQTMVASLFMVALNHAQMPRVTAMTRMVMPVVIVDLVLFLRL